MLKLVPPSGAATRRPSAKRGPMQLSFRTDGGALVWEQDQTWQGAYSSWEL